MGWGGNLLMIQAVGQNVQIGQVQIRFIHLGIIFILVFEMYSRQQRKQDEPQQEDVTIINLVGDLRQNMRELIDKMNCRCGMDQHLRSILGIYCQKISKLRYQRDHYKSLYEQLLLQAKGCTTPGPGNLSRASTNPIHEHHREQSNIFQLLQKEFVPVSVKLNKCQNERSSISYLLNENPNPEDSLLISESSTHRNNECDKECKENSEGLGRTFEQYLQEKAVQNQMRLKITEDLISLSSKKNRPGSKVLQPVTNRMY